MQLGVDQSQTQTVKQSTARQLSSNVQQSISRNLLYTNGQNNQKQLTSDSATSASQQVKVAALAKPLVGKKKMVSASNAKA